MSDLEKWQRQVRDLHNELRALRGDPMSSLKLAPPEAPAKRMTLSRMLELMLTRTAGVHDSVTLSRNAKGETQIEVTGRARDEETLEDVAVRVRDEYDRLRARYPLADGNVGAKAAT